ncbi:hypothetical protein GI374_02430 [Paracoccus sp. S-4012]|uniref:calcium-binding protein n=1 Tax=Paracoccus sp. S-4012 TaxID=2665648 RepID=UPI0012B13F62|nr:hypothetical protein [Paracoccus sp. S-4012]MRX49317.1 hypothetical protein [Paracoccus sp. S-4012]
MSYYGRLNTGFQVGQSISPLGETDTFQTAFIQGLTYSVTARGADSGGGTLGDPHMSITTTGGTQLYYDDDDGTGRDAQIVFTAGTTGDLFVNVAENGNNATGTYTLVISPGYASNFNDSVTGTVHGDAIAGMAGNDSLAGAGGDDYLYGQDGNDRLWGGAGTDRLFGGNGADQLFGGDARDILWGADGNDTLMGNAGSDILTGGLGADRFVFDDGDSTTAAMDHITAGGGGAAIDGAGQAGGDVIDLSLIDANIYLAGDQAFRWATTGEAGTALLYEYQGNTIVYGYTDNVAGADVAIFIQDGAGVTANTYITSDFIL